MDTASWTAADFDIFVQKLRATMGLNLALYKRPQVERRLNSLRAKKGFKTFTEFYQALIHQPELYTELINQLTINVTEFFRNPERWSVLKNKVIPDLVTRNKRLKVWSAGCSTGEESYSLALVLSQFVNLRDIVIHATDLDQAVIERANIGRYEAQSVQSVPADLLKRYFRYDQGQYVVSEEIKQCVQFRRHDLLTDTYDTGYDLITCRNVLIYFTEEAKEQVLLKFHQSLRPGGYLFVGATEHMMFPSKYGFTMVDMFFYKKL